MEEANEEVVGEGRVEEAVGEEEEVVEDITHITNNMEVDMRDKTRMGLRVRRKVGHHLKEEPHRVMVLACLLGNLVLNHLGSQETSKPSSSVHAQDLFR